MKNSIIFCHTPFQCITALILRMNNMDVDNQKSSIVIIDDFAYANEIYNKFKDIDLFDEVYFGSYSLLQSKKKLFIATVFPKFFVKKTGFNVGNYTDLYTNNVFGDFENVVLYYNKDANVHLFDEGYSSYLEEYLNGYYHYSFMHSLAYKLSKLIFSRRLISECYSDLYLFDKRLLTYDASIQIKDITLPTKTDIFLDYVKHIFNLDDVLGDFSSKYILFEESFFIDKESTVDIDAFLKISNVIGKDQTLIKLHPRDKKNRFLDTGIKTNNRTEIPWEAIILGLEIKNKVFITFSSGAAINYLFFGCNGYKTIFLYKVYPQMGEMTESKLMWFELFKKYYGDNVFVPETESELFDLLKRL